jgi:hypothetical protein
MRIASQITNAFQTAVDRLPELAQRWIQASVQLGEKLPPSGLMMSVQREGSLDLVLRCMEDELATAPGLDFSWHYQKMLSEYWISGLYETLRLLRDRMLLGREADDLFADVELVRMVIDKHNIPKDRDLKRPLQLVRQSVQEITSRGYVYDKSDPQRANIPPVGLKDGSVAWHVIDLHEKANRWVVRQHVSDLVLSLWGQPDDPNKG